MKQILLFFLIIGFITNASAQDIIILRNGSKIETKVNSFSSARVSYKDADGKTVIINTSEVRDVFIGGTRVFSANGDPVSEFHPSDVIPAVGSTENHKTSLAESVVPDPLAFSSGYRNTSYPIQPGMRYGEYKKYYNPRDYVYYIGDQYSAKLAGFLSFLLPGAGQAYEDQALRGLGFFLGTGVLSLGTSYCLTAASYDQSLLYAGIGLSLCTLGLWTWNVLDAVRVAKIKNMYYQDVRLMRGINPNIIVHPYVSCSSINNNLVPNAGLALNISF